MRKGLVWTLAALLLLGVGGWFGDNWLRGYAQDQAVKAAGSYLGDGDATVTLGGTPFFLSLFTRSVPEARLTVDALPLEMSGKKVRLTDVVADTGRISLGTDTVSIATLAGSARLGYADMAKIADVPITYARNGRLELRYNQDIFGRKVTFAVSALPDLDVEGQVIRLTEPKLELADTTLDLGLTQDQLDSIIQPIKVDLDHDLRLTRLVPDDGGIAIGVDGTNLSLPIAG